MRFSLEIELGNADMQTADDVGRALKQQGCLLRGCSFEHEKSGTLRDLNGNTVGKWEAKEHREDIQEASIALLLWDYLKKDPEHKDRRQTSFGTKTKQGLFASIKRIIAEN